MRKLSRSVILLGLLTFLMCFVLVTDIVPWLRGAVPWLPGREAWVWLYDLPCWSWLFLAGAVMVIYVAGGLRLVHWERRYPVHLILWSFVGSVLLTLLLMGIEQDPLFLLFSRSAALLTGGYQQSATLITNLGSTLQHWPEFMRSYFAQYSFGSTPTSPPGLTSLYYATMQVLDAVPALAHPLSQFVRPLECQNLTLMAWTDAQLASAWPQMLMPLWAALSVAPLYSLGASVFDRRVARWAVLLWPLIPGLALFAPRFNTLFVLIGLVMLSLLWRGLDRRRWKWIIVAGFVLSMGTFFNLSVFPLGLLAGLTIIGHYVRARGSIIALLRTLLYFGIGCLSVWVIYNVLAGVSILDILRLGFDQHFEQHDRPYLPWLFMHPYDMFLFVGLPIAGLVFWRLRAFRRDISRADIFSYAGILALIAVVLSGTARGETGRLWLFFAPVWLLIGADFLTRLRSRDQMAVVILQAVYCLSIAAVLRVGFTTFTVPPTPARVLEPAVNVVNAHFVQGDDRLTLVGFDAVKQPTNLELHLHWRADKAISRPYVLSMIPVRPDGSYEKSLNWDPLNWNYPPTCWSPGQEFVDTVAIPLEPAPLPGGWMFSVAVTDVFTHQAMLVNGPRDVQIGIGPVSLP